MPEPYSGAAAEAAAKAKARRAANGGYPSKLARRYAEAKAAAKTALLFLESDHIQNNKFRMGAIAAQDILSAVVALRSITALSNTDPRVTKWTEARK